MKSFRLFIGNIPPQTSEEELKNEFGSYGRVQNVEIKSKGDDNVFGFINLETDDSMVGQCIREFGEQKFKGVFLNVSRAKESFLDRLKREREEAEMRKVLRQRLPQKPQSQPEQPETAELPKFNVDEKAIASGSENEDEEPVLQSHASKTLQPQEFEEIVKKFSTSKRKYADSAPTATIKPPKVLDADEEKRLKGLDSIKSAYESQKRLIQTALSSADGTGSNKKIKFDRDDDDADGNRMTLFDDDDDNDLVADKKMFEVKKQFQGEKGEALFQLQSKFKHDSRFVMGPEFMEENGQKLKPTEPAGKKKKQSAGEKERDAQLRLLQEMGASVNNRPQASRDKQQMSMIRFDPSKVGHEKYKKTHENGPIDEAGNKIVEREEFQVSNERYVKVNADLKQALQHSGEFSLLQMFGQAPAAVPMEEDNNEADQSLPFPGRKFHYDSSDGEDNEVIETKQLQPKQGDPKKRKAKILYQKFFFYLDDERLKEGLLFFTAKTERKNPEQVAEARKNLKQIVKQKIKKSNAMQVRKEQHVTSFKKTFRGKKPNNNFNNRRNNKSNK